MTSNVFIPATLFVATLAILIGFGVWPVAAAVLLLIAGMIVYGSVQTETVKKLESRISLVQVSGQEAMEKFGKTIDDISNSINFVHEELRRFTGSFEARLDAMELPRSEDTQKYYDLVQKVIDLENRIGILQRSHVQTVQAI